jgi:hypothetical protein
MESPLLHCIEIYIANRFPSFVPVANIDDRLGFGRGQVGFINKINLTRS